MKLALLPMAASVLLVGCSSLPSLPTWSLAKSSSEPSTPTGQTQLTGRSATIAAPRECRRQIDQLARAKQLVVTIRTRFSTSGAEEFGAGVIVGLRNNIAFVTTARHVIHKDRAGQPVIEVYFGESQHAAPFAATPIALPPPAQGDPVNDLAVVQVDMRRDPQAVAPHWAILRKSSEVFHLKDVAVIGNPANQGKTPTPPGPAQFVSATELRVTTGGVMQQGYSGGGAFDRQWRLVGLVHSDNSTFASAYPIETVLHKFKSFNIPVDLTLAPDEKPDLHLPAVAGEPAGLARSIDVAFRDALRKDGYEPDCPSPEAYALNVTVSGWSASAMSSNATVSAKLVAPDRSERTVSEALAFTHGPYQNVWEKPDQLADKAQTVARGMIQKLTDAKR